MVEVSSAWPEKMSPPRRASPEGLVMCDAVNEWFKRNRKEWAAVQGAEIVASDYVQPMLPTEEVGDFLKKFEKVAVRRKWPRDRWPKLLQPLLRIEFRSVYHLMDWDQDDYCKFKEEILLRGVFQRIMDHQQCSRMGEVSPEDQDFGNAEKREVSCHGRLGKVVSPERRVQQSTSCMRYSQPVLECKSAVIPSNRNRVLPTGGISGSRKAAVLLRDHMGASACGDTTDERHRTQVKAMTPAAGTGKTVSVYGY